MFKQTTALLNKMLLINQEPAYCSLTKMRKIIPQYFAAYARLVTESFGCAWPGLKRLCMHPKCLTKWAFLPPQTRQLSGQMVVASVSTTASFLRGSGTSPRHFLADPWAHAQLKLSPLSRSDLVEIQNLSHSEEFGVWCIALCWWYLNTL